MTYIIYIYNIYKIYINIYIYIFIIYKYISPWWQIVSVRVIRSDDGKIVMIISVVFVFEKTQTKDIIITILWPRISVFMHPFATNYCNTTSLSMQIDVCTGQHGLVLNAKVIWSLWFAIHLTARNFSCQCGLWIDAPKGLCMKPFNEPCWP